MMMWRLATPSEVGIPMAMPVLPSTVACLSAIVAPGMSAAALYRAARRSAGTTPVRRPSATTLILEKGRCHGCDVVRQSR